MGFPRCFRWQVKSSCFAAVELGPPVSSPVDGLRSLLCFQLVLLLPQTGILLLSYFSVFFVLKWHV